MSISSGRCCGKVPETGVVARRQDGFPAWGECNAEIWSPQHCQIPRRLHPGETSVHHHGVPSLRLRSSLISRLISALRLSIFNEFPFSPLRWLEDVPAVTKKLDQLAWLWRGFQCEADEHCPWNSQGSCLPQRQQICAQVSAFYIYLE